MFCKSIYNFSLTILHPMYPWIPLYLCSNFLHLFLPILINICIFLFFWLHYKNVLLPTFSLKKSLLVFMLFFLLIQLRLLYILRERICANLIWLIINFCSILAILWVSHALPRGWPEWEQFFFDFRFRNALFFHFNLKKLQVKFLT